MITDSLFTDSFAPVLDSEMSQISELSNPIVRNTNVNQSIPIVPVMRFEPQTIGVIRTI